jgi:hypothetical protein
VLPVSITLEPVPMSVADACTGTFEIMVDGITIQALPITYQVSQ